MTRLQEKYTKEVVPQMKKMFDFKNNLAVPRIVKVTFNVGLGKNLKDEKYIELAKKSLERISGQKPILTKARKSISEFKIKKGLPVGLKVTLRGRRMYEFIDKMINVALPRVRDFRGLKKESIDSKGNLNTGFTEHIVFPEIRAEEVESIFGLEVAVSTNAKDFKKGQALLKLLGFPFKKEEKD